MDSENSTTIMAYEQWYGRPARTKMPFPLFFKYINSFPSHPFFLLDALMPRCLNAVMLRQ